MKEFLTNVSAEKKREGVLVPEIEELREPIKRLFEQIRPRLEGGDYQRPGARRP